MKGLAELTDKLTVEIGQQDGKMELPCVRILKKDGTDTGLAFHGVPGGHEFTSFVLGLYNASGSGQEIEQETAEQIRSIAYPVNMRVLVTLTCSMCPELVTAAQKIAAGNDRVRAEIYDINHYPALRDQYQVMSVPCLVINDTEVSFGKKNIRQVLELIQKASS